MSVLRPGLTFEPQFSHYALEIDDSAETDILSHLPSAVDWIQEALDLRRQAAENASMAEGDDSQIHTERAGDLSQKPKPGGILVHCQAGVSRSATIVAAYLIQTMALDPVEAVQFIRQTRAHVDPSDTFMEQLAVYHKANARVSLRDRDTRRFFMNRMTTDFLNGDGGAAPVDKMAKYPATPTPSNPATPIGGQPRRKIRCKMCRRHLAMREHMMDHILDQSPLPRQRTSSNVSGISTPAIASPMAMEAKPMVVSDVVNPLTGQPGATRSRPTSSSSNAGLSPFTSLTPDTDSPQKADSDRGGSVPVPRKPRLSSSNDETPKASTNPLPVSPTVAGDTMSDSVRKSSRTFQSAEQLTSRLPPHLLALRSVGQGTMGLSSPISSSPPSSPEREAPPSIASSNNTTTQTARRKLSSLAMTPTPSDSTSVERKSSVHRASSLRDRNASLGEGVANLGMGGPPILTNPKCSGYFVEPLRWMEPVLASGDISGKLVCPNDKCGAKIGNFDWAGVQCGCKEWVTPVSEWRALLRCWLNVQGFCIHRSKVDEVW